MTPMTALEKDQAARTARDADPRRVAALTIGLALECRRFGDRRQGDLSRVDAEGADKTLLHLGKRIVPRRARGEKGALPAAAIAAAKALRKIERLDDAAQTACKNLGLPSFFKAGTHRIPLGLFVELDEKLEQLAVERGPLVADFVRLYPAMIDAMAEPLGPQFRRADYPSPETVAQRFSFAWQWFEIDTVPDQLKAVAPAAYRRAARRLEQSREAMADGVRAALRDDAFGAVRELAKKLAGVGEEPRQFRQATILRDVTEFFRTFPLRNVTDDAALADWLSDVRTALDGLDLDAVKNDGNGQAALKTALTGMLKRAPRAIDLG